MVLQVWSNLNDNALIWTFWHCGPPRLTERSGNIVPIHIRYNRLALEAFKTASKWAFELCLSVIAHVSSNVFQSVQEIHKICVSPDRKGSFLWSYFTACQIEMCFIPLTGEWAWIQIGQRPNPPPPLLQSRQQQQQRRRDVVGERTATEPRTAFQSTAKHYRLLVFLLPRCCCFHPSRRQHSRERSEWGGWKRGTWKRRKRSKRWTGGRMSTPEHVNQRKSERKRASAQK